MTTQHTPTPLTLSQTEAEASRLQKLSPLQQAVAAIEARRVNRQTTYTAANILDDFYEPIVRACNAHEPMFEALKQVRFGLKLRADKEPKNLGLAQDLQAVDAAIAKAEGK